MGAPTLIEAFDPLVGRRVLGRYRVVRVLATGGQGTVYLARGEGAAGFVRPLVIKRILDRFEADPGRQDHFAREARITAQLRHPGVVPVIDFARDGDSYLMVLEYVHGFNLRHWERYMRRTGRQFPVHLAVYATLKTLEALDYAHTLRGADRRLLNVIHRDISPSNVLVDVGGHVKLTDFGIARMQSEQTTQTDARQHIKGKLPYIAPEMFREEPPSVASDVYACGVMLHELLAGTNEFRGGNAAAVAIRALEHIPTRLDVLRDDVSPRLADVVARALAKDPTERPGSAASLAEALRDAIGQDLGDLRTSFCAAVKNDFENPRMPRVLGVPDLASLELCWRDWQTEGDSEHSDDLEADRIPPQEAASPPREPDSGRWLSWGLVTTAALAVFALAWRGPDALAGQAPQYVYAAYDAGVAQAAPPDPAKSKAAALTEAFSERQAEVARCFAAHGAEAARLWVHFAIDSSGSVRRTRITPEAQADTPLAECVLDVAETVQFGPQPEPMAFRIPIRARR